MPKRFHRATPGLCNKLLSQLEELALRDAKANRIRAQLGLPPDKFWGEMIKKMNLLGEAVRMNADLVSYHPAGEPQ